MPRRTAVTLALLLLAGAAPAVAQDALGDGRALDNNLQVGETHNPSADQPDYAARNNLITGNAPGLSGFKGRVGYRAPGDFQGALSSDNLFQFNTRSLPAGQTAPWRVDYGDLPVYRSLSPVTAQDITSGKANRLVPRDAAQAGNPIFNLPDTGAATEAEPLNRLDARRYDGRALELDASPLLGLRLKPRGGNDVDIHIRGAQPDGSSPAAPADALDQERGGGQPQSLLQRLDVLDRRDRTDAKADKPDAAADEHGDVYYQLLQKVRDNQAQQEAAAAALGARGIETSRPAPRVDAPAAGIADFARLIDYQAAALTTLAAPGDDYVDRTLRSAEANLHASRYFDAEHDYRAVLQLQPGHPMARIGLVHAQIGVGMILTAGHNLRQLFIRHPELIAARYDARLLPDAQRLTWARQQLETMMQRDGRRLEPAILLAYLHYQASRADDLRAALDAAQQRAPEDELPPLLRSVWLRQADGSAP